MPTLPSHPKRPSHKLTPDYIANSKLLHPDWYQDREITVCIDTTPGTSADEKLWLQGLFHHNVMPVVDMHDVRRRGSVTGFTSWFEADFTGREEAAGIVIPWGATVATLPQQPGVEMSTCIVFSDLRNRRKEDTVAWSAYLTLPRTAGEGPACDNHGCPLIAAGIGGARLKACSRCRNVRYCSRACQQAHWPEHKKTCTCSLT